MVAIRCTHNMLQYVATEFQCINWDAVQQLVAIQPFWTEMHTATKIAIIVVIIIVITIVIVIIIIIIIMHTAQRFNFSDGSYCSQELIQGSCTSNCILPEQFQSTTFPFVFPFICDTLHVFLNLPRGCNFFCHLPKNRSASQCRESCRFASKDTFF